MTVHLVVDGGFAARVAAAAADLVDIARTVPLADVVDPADLMADGRATVLVTPRFDWREVHAFDAAARRAGHPWCFVGYAFPYVFVGPTSVAGGPCYRCLEVRLRQHGRTEIPLDGVPVPVPDGHVDGIAPHLADSVAGLLAGLLDSADRSVCLVHVSGLKVRSEVLVGVHGCPRCAAGSGRGHAELLRVARQWRDA